MTNSTMSQFHIDKQEKTEKDDVMAYAGIFRDAWGDSAEQIETSIHNLRNEWES